MTTATRDARFTSLHVFWAVLIATATGRFLLGDVVLAPGLRTAATVFVAVCVQALPCTSPPQ